MYKLLLHLPCSNGESLHLKLLYETIPGVDDGWWFPCFIDQPDGGSELSFHEDSLKVTYISHQAGCVVVGVDDESGDESSDFDKMQLGNVGWFPSVDNLSPGWEENTPPWKTLTEITGRDCSIVT